MYRSTTKRVDGTLYFDAVHLPPDKQIPPHAQNTWELSCVVTGEGTRLLGNVSERFCAEDTVLIPPGIPHSWYFDGDKTDDDGKIENISIFFSGDLLRNVQQCFAEMSDSVADVMSLKNAIVFSGSSRTQIYSTMLRMRNETSAKRVLSLLEILLVIAQDTTGRVVTGISPMTRQEMRMTQIRSFVNCNYMRQITIDEVASYVGMNRSSFCSFFKRSVGQTFTHFLNDRRIAIACELLGNDDMNIGEIGPAVGIHDTPYFCCVFKAHRGVTPTEYRDNARRQRVAGEPQEV